LTTQPFDRIEIDVCPDHGVWLDKGELEALVGTIKSQQVQRARRIIRQRDLTTSRDRMLNAVTLLAFLK
jgi:Zn-finger nucleic acid-binding protein